MGECQGGSWPSRSWEVDSCPTGACDTCASRPQPRNSRRACPGMGRAEPAAGGAPGTDCGLSSRPAPAGRPGLPEERQPVSDGRPAVPGPAHPALGSPAGHAHSAAGDRRLHHDQRGPQVEQAQVRASPTWGLGRGPSPSQARPPPTQAGCSPFSAANGVSAPPAAGLCHPPWPSVTPPLPGAVRMGAIAGPQPAPQGPRTPGGPSGARVGGSGGKTTAVTAAKENAAPSCLGQRRVPSEAPLRPSAPASPSSSTGQAGGGRSGPGPAPRPQCQGQVALLCEPEPWSPQLLARPLSATDLKTASRVSTGHTYCPRSAGSGGGTPSGPPDAEGPGPGQCPLDSTVCTHWLQ